MPRDPADVGVDDVFEALSRLGTPTVFYAADHEPPDARDIPQLLGVLSLACDKLAVTHRLATDPAARSAWAAGYLGTVGAANPCTARAAFDIITLRLQMLEDLLAGFNGGGVTVDLVRTCLAATRAFAVIAAAGNALKAGLFSTDDQELNQMMVQQIEAAEQAMATARVLQARFRTNLEQPGLRDGDGAGE